ncbi:hypothetical protein SAMN05421810_103412 [Amycolatopsis arida]|uniref:DUF6286 domain-containing protein n=1 Tax=Amycolatopsis arida TaxID=587909 RepID=A0A1I5T7A4_9PSEU|nr:DUF6286 domain-containing protein [Amycolatopsis arida]TDX96209.1 hypothetical protein CLV69_103346 [Amycolatopsis arida]SFP78701.1 hypothetical protein SAMN05421810_103412 [Amycolatopsis arida]
MIRRPRRAVPAALVAVAVLAGAVVVAVSAVQLMLDRPPLVDYDAVASALHGTHWNEWPVAVAGGVVGLLGLALVLAAVLPGRPVVLPLATPEGVEADAGATRRGLRASLHDAVAAVDGVAAARVRLRPRKVAVRVRTNRARDEGLAEAVRDAVERRLDQIDFAVRPRPRVRVRSAR